MGMAAKAAVTGCDESESRPVIRHREVSFLGRPSFNGNSLFFKDVSDSTHAAIVGSERREELLREYSELRTKSSVQEYLEESKRMLLHEFTIRDVFHALGPTDADGIVTGPESYEWPRTVKVVIRLECLEEEKSDN